VRPLKQPDCESEPFVMVTFDPSVRRCRNYVSSPLCVCVCVCVCVGGCVRTCAVTGVGCEGWGGWMYFLLQGLPESQRRD